MKIYGICGKQSARKHRQRSDYVIHLRGFPGRYTWLHHATLSPADEKVSARQVRQEQRVMFYDAKLAKAITGIEVRCLIVDEGFYQVDDNKISERMRSLLNKGVCRD